MESLSWQYFLETIKDRSTVENSREKDSWWVHRSTFSLTIEEKRATFEIFSFRANLYPCPENVDERQELAMGVMARLEDLNVVLRQTQDHCQHLLAIVSKSIRTWQIQLLKIKSIYSTMNLFDNDLVRRCFIAGCWTPNNTIEQVQLALRKGLVGFLWRSFLVEDFLRSRKPMEIIPCHRFKIKLRPMINLPLIIVSINWPKGFKIWSMRTALLPIEKSIRCRSLSSRFHSFLLSCLTTWDTDVLLLYLHSGWLSKKNN